MSAWFMRLRPIPCAVAFVYLLLCCVNPMLHQHSSCVGVDCAPYTTFIAYDQASLGECETRQPNLFAASQYTDSSCLACEWNGLMGISNPQPSNPQVVMPSTPLRPSGYTFHTIQTFSLYHVRGPPAV